MAKHVSAYPGTLILPNGDEIALGAEAEISAEMAKNAGVAEWIELGWLAPKAEKAADKK